MASTAAEDVVWSERRGVSEEGQATCTMYPFHRRYDAWSICSSCENGSLLRTSRPFRCLQVKSAYPGSPKSTGRSGMFLCVGARLLLGVGWRFIGFFLKIIGLHLIEVLKRQNAPARDKKCG